MWEPADRIFLFGFSRGAYTVRCVGGVLKLCGVPVLDSDGAPLRRDPAIARAVATQAVKHVYQFGSSKEGNPYQKARNGLAGRFRATHGSAHASVGDRPNAAPYFIGVWDTVAALGLTAGRLIVLGAVLLGLLLLAAAFVRWFLVAAALARPDLGDVFWPLLLFWLACGFMAYLRAHLKFTTRLDVPWWRTVHLTGWRMRFHDEKLDPNVGFARQALAIDENRADFEAVEWTPKQGERPDAARDGVVQVKQVWFAGAHSDVGGSYNENESRLSDIALKWMLDEATALPFPLRFDPDLLRLWPSSDGVQHDERCAVPGGLPRWLSRLIRRVLPPTAFCWEFRSRTIDSHALLHPSVPERFALPSVLIDGWRMPYRPVALRRHAQVRGYYDG
ncbi:MAG TPA: DUF2235 domain-containing protein [Mesorhizobium sp.]|jgi:hypothetical protein|nr:DUF2235 domain-containing protein [Mesorhizobium sp.]